LVPFDCHPHAVANSDELAALAYRLVREQCMNFQSAPAVHRMASIFAAASQRVSQIIMDARHEAQRRAYFEKEKTRP